MIRHRQSAFPSPLTCPEMEPDPERALWVPHRRDRIFVPATAPPKPMFNVGTLSVTMDWSRLEASLQNFERHMQTIAQWQESVAQIELPEGVYRSLDVFEDRALRLLGTPVEVRGRWERPAENALRSFDEIIDCSPGRHEFLDVTRMDDRIFRRQLR